MHNLSLQGKDLRTILGIPDSGINLTLQMFKCQILGQDINELGSRVGGRPGSDQASLREGEGGRLVIVISLIIMLAAADTVRVTQHSALIV